MLSIKVTNYTRKKTNVNPGLVLNDIVIIKDDDVRARAKWRLGRVESFVIGSDGQIRGANLRTISKTYRQTKMSRHLQKIIPLEVVETPEVNPRPRRQCAVTGEERRRAMGQK